VWERLRAKVRRVFLIVFVAIWTAVGASLYANGHPGNEVFWLFYAAVWAWYAATVVVPDIRRRRAG
jgi:hypothetical protein